VHNSQEGQPAIILVRPQMGENIGAAARVLANFGLTDLRLVCPRDGWPNPKAQAMSAGAIKDTGPVRVYDDLAAAIADCSMVLAVSARLRDMEKEVYDPVDGAAALRDHLHAGGHIALLFGAESSGLNNADVALCDGLITYPVDPGFSSLNLAQAVAVFAYEWRLGRQEEQNPARSDNLSPAANKEELIGLFGHLETELDQAGFFFPPEKQTMMMRNIQNALTKAQLTEQEVRTFRGIIRALARGRGGRT
jgi:tRNA/rRNA methyltransferase